MYTLYVQVQESVAHAHDPHPHCGYDSIQSTPFVYLIRQVACMYVVATHTSQGAHVCVRGMCALCTCMPVCALYVTHTHVLYI
jgi:hypothetical protein